MRRFWLAACVLSPLLPGLALAQVADNSAPPPAPDMMGGPGMMTPPDGGPDGGWKDHGHHGPEMNGTQTLLAFYAANTTHDGHLTLAQAKAADFTPVVDNFPAIDVNHHGYVTFYDIVAWHMDDMAKHLEQQATALRAKD